MITRTTTRWLYPTDAGGNNFIFDNRVLNATDLAVTWLDSSANVLGTPGYIVMGVGNPAGGTVVFNSDLPATVGSTLILERTTARVTTGSDPVDYIQDPAATRIYNNDQRLALVQELYNELLRTWRFSPLELDGPFVLPPPAARAGKIMAFDAAGLPIVIDSSLLIASLPVGATILQPGIYPITDDTTLANDVLLMPGASFLISAGKVLTCNGNITASPTAVVFAGAGTASLPGQRTWVYLEWWGADPTGVLSSSAALAAAHAALLNGGAIKLNRADYRMTAGQVFTNAVDLLGAGRALNPTLGGTILRVDTTFAHSGGKLLSMATGSLTWRDFTILGSSTTDDTMTYVGIHTGTGAGKFHLENIEVLGCGVGFWFEEGNTGTIIDCSSYYFALAGRLFGGTANKFSSEYRSYGGVVNNPNTTGVTNGATAAGNAVIHMADTTAVAIGMGFAAFNMPNGSKVLAKTANTVTLDQIAIDTGVPNAGAVRFGWMLTAVMVDFQWNAFDINHTDLLTAGGQALVRVQGTPDIGAGKHRPDTIFFQNLNATASTYNGVFCNAGTKIRFRQSWLGDVPFGNVVEASAASLNAADLGNLALEGTTVGAGGKDGVYTDYLTNLSIDGQCEFIGNGQLAPNFYNDIYCSPNTVGDGSITGTKAVNEGLDDETGQVAYAVYLDTGSFGGAGNKIMVALNMLSGLTGAINDGSSPATTKKVITANAY
jgi:hypothetical protein